MITLEDNRLKNLGKIYAGGEPWSKDLKLLAKECGFRELLEKVWK